MKNDDVCRVLYNHMIEIRKARWKDEKKLLKEENRILDNIRKLMR